MIGVQSARILKGPMLEMRSSAKDEALLWDDVQLQSAPSPYQRIYLYIWMLRLGSVVVSYSRRCHIRSSFEGTRCSEPFLFYIYPQNQGQMLDMSSNSMPFEVESRKSNPPEVLLIFLFEWSIRLDDTFGFCCFWSTITFGAHLIAVFNVHRMLARLCIHVPWRFRWGRLSCQRDCLQVGFIPDRCHHQWYQSHLASILLCSRFASSFLLSHLGWIS